MHNFKHAYVEGFKDGLTLGIEKGMELAEYFEDSNSNNSDCPPNTTPLMVESVPSESME